VAGGKGEDGNSSGNTRTAFIIVESILRRIHVSTNIYIYSRNLHYLDKTISLRDRSSQPRTFTSTPLSFISSSPLPSVTLPLSSSSQLPFLLSATAL
jgi:hypothetical protein